MIAVKRYAQDQINFWEKQDNDFVYGSYSKEFMLITWKRERNNPGSSLLAKNNKLPKDYMNLINNGEKK